MMAKEGAIAIHEPNYRYDVFLSFRGSDTRRTFTGNLYNALRLKRFKTFMDEGGLKSGDPIASSILEAVEDSRISIVVLSKYYAYSSWCLEELVKILDCKKEKNQLVLPIFYDVDPSDVRRQRGAYGEAMARHEDRSRKDSEKVRRWRYGYDYELIQKIVEGVTRSLPRYDVFLSFCGEDTRYSFTGFLYDALCQEGFNTFMNDERLKDGDQLSESLNAIEKSRLSIIVFSQNYACSSLRLDELVMILDCMKMKNGLVWPIFYKVEPSDIRHQRNNYGKAMETHENRIGKDSKKVQEWRLALSQVANLKGWHLKFGYEYELVKKIVDIAIKISNG
ncbi:disease resistance protein RPS4-like isoform X2 [Gastrolobium bilobum]|uniref:disease resistance protein RPS4-like isoform X2 n=1 Tax=Gastrolobium bilobum TaxID=150636 RepID=UPI002AB2BC07|nr:disease resistance protein RPS4-like isoform X2 [Gastrolobium bilobum]